MTSATEKPVVSVLIVCHNDGAWLPRCLESIRAQTIFEKIEIIIADNASDDGSDRSAQQLIADWPNASFFSTGGDRGFCVGINLAAERARGEYLQFLNPDTWLEPDFLEQFVRAVQEAGTPAAGPVVLNYEDDNIQSLGGAGFDFCANCIDAPMDRPPNPVMCIASFVFIRRDLFLKLGKLDEKSFMYGEEMDLSWRILIAGENITFAKGARIHHRGAVGTNPDGASNATANRTSTQKRFLANRNRLLFIAKNCQHVLLITFIPCAAVVMVEGVATLLMTRRWGLAMSSCFDALTDFWRMRRHIIDERRRIARFRRRSDFWMLRFFRLGFGRWHEVSKILKAGFPKFR